MIEQAGKLVPTDNVYKFVAVSGVVLAVACIVWPVHNHERAGEKLSPAALLRTRV
jgi:hypothetical protein